MLLKLKVIMVTMVLIIVFTGCSKNSSVADVGAGDVIAEVNNEKIFTDEVNKMVDGIVTAYAQYYQQMGQQLGEEELNTMKSEYKNHIIDQMITEKLLLQEAKKNNISVSAAEIEQEFAIFKQEMGGNEEEYDNMLTMMGFENEENFKEKFSNNILIRKFVEDKFDFEPISESDLKDFYDENLELFETSENRMIEHILFRVGEDATETEKQELYDELYALRNEIVDDGKDFNEIAEEYSECPSRSNQGKLGRLEKGMLDPSFEDSAFSLQKDEISDVVETQFGYHLIRVTEIIAGQTFPFLDVKDRIEEELTSENRQSKLQNLIIELREDADIKYFDR